MVVYITFLTSAENLNIGDMTSQFSSQRFIAFGYLSCHFLATACIRSKMTSREYDQYKSVIDVANAHKDKNALREIQKQLIVRFGADNEDVIYLIKRFDYTV